MKRFCNHCGQLYEGDRCSCRKNVKREYRHSDFYNTEAWAACSRFVRTRDYNKDRLQLYFINHVPDGKIEKQLYDFVMDADGMPRRFDGRNIVHHIQEVEMKWADRYKIDNLITLNYHTHEFVHQLYANGNREAVQALLTKAVTNEV